MQPAIFFHCFFLHFIQRRPYLLSTFSWSRLSLTSHQTYKHKDSGTTKHAMVFAWSYLIAKRCGEELSVLSWDFCLPAPPRGVSVDVKKSTVSSGKG